MTSEQLIFLAGLLTGIMASLSTTIIILLCRSIHAAWQKDKTEREFDRMRRTFPHIAPPGKGWHL